MGFLNVRIIGNINEKITAGIFATVALTNPDRRKRRKYIQIKPIGQNRAPQASKASSINVFHMFHNLSFMHCCVLSSKGSDHLTINMIKNIPLSEINEMFSPLSEN